MSKKLLSQVAAAVAAAIIASPCLAADEATDEGQPFIEEIIVTAEKREENILEVPLTMSAFSDQMIEETGMTNNADLEQLVPGLQFGDDHGTSIRGIISQLRWEGHTDLAVAVYVNGVYTVDAYGIAPNLFDMERVEVARGPQGTMNGRNSIAGSISYFHKKPTDEWDAEILTEFTDQFTQRYNVAWGGPISDNLSFRISGGYFEGDGAQKNHGPARDYDAPDQYSIAPQLRFKTDRFEANLRYERTEDTGAPSTQVSLAEPDRTDPDFAEGAFYQYDKPIRSITNCNVAPVGADHRVTGVEPPCDDPKNEISTNLDGRLDNETDRFTLRADFDLTDTLTLRYIYGDTRTRMFQTRDFDHTDRVPSATDPLIAADAPVKLLDVEFDFPFENDETSHELLLTSNYDGPFNFVAGAFSYENRTLFGVGVYGVRTAAPVYRHRPRCSRPGYRLRKLRAGAGGLWPSLRSHGAGAFFLSQARNRSHWEHHSRVSTSFSPSLPKPRRTPSRISPMPSVRSMISGAYRGVCATPKMKRFWDRVSLSLSSASLAFQLASGVKTPPSTSFPGIKLSAMSASNIHHSTMPSSTGVSPPAIAPAH